LFCFSPSYFNKGLHWVKHDMTITGGKRQVEQVHIRWVKYYTIITCGKGKVEQVHIPWGKYYMIIACGKGKVEQVHIKIKCGHGVLLDTVKCWIQNCCGCIKIEENKIHRRFKSTYFAYLVLWLYPCLLFLE
jgi:hypothetical protein